MSTLTNTICKKSSYQDFSNAKKKNSKCDKTIDPKKKLNRRGDFFISFFSKIIHRRLDKTLIVRKNQKGASRAQRARVEE